MRRISMILLCLLFINPNALLARDRVSSVTALRDTSLLRATSIGNGIVRIYNKLSGITTEKTMSPYTASDSITANLVINMNTLDTSQYSQMYSLWKDVPVAGWYPPPVVSDENHNGEPEITGDYLQYGENLPGPVEIYEEQSDSSFASRYTYPKSTSGSPWSSPRKMDKELSLG